MARWPDSACARAAESLAAQPLAAASFGPAPAPLKRRRLAVPTFRRAFQQRDDFRRALGMPTLQSAALENALDVLVGGRTKLGVKVFHCHLAFGLQPPPRTKLFTNAGKGIGEEPWSDSVDTTSVLPSKEARCGASEVGVVAEELFHLCLGQTACTNVPVLDVRRKT